MKISEIKDPEEFLKKMGEYLLEGLSEDEACILIGVDPAEFREKKEKNEEVRLFVEKQRIEFKRTHLKEITTKRSDKNSQWLLEKLRPEEFGNKKQTDGTTVNIIGAIVKAIQNGKDNKDIITVQSETVHNGDKESNESNTAQLSVAGVLK